MAWVLMLAIVVLAIVYVFYNYGRIRKMSEGTPEMAEMAGIIRSGASTFLKTEFRTVAIVVVLVARGFLPVCGKDQRHYVHPGRAA